MKRIISITLVMIFAFIAGCQTQSTDMPTDIPDDFGFEIHFGTYGINCIDTYNNTFTKDLVTAGTETIDFVIPADKMHEIYAAFVKYKISELPDDINSEVDAFIIGRRYMSWTPASQYILTYTFNEETRTICCDDGGPWYEQGPPKTRDRLVEFVKIIEEYIYSTEEYQKMSPHQGLYL